MIEFGKTLRTARENKGLAIGQLAETTHLTPGMVKDLENEDFSNIAAPIYGRGFIKLYCAAVGLDPKPLIAEYMAVVNGEHEPQIRTREVAPPTAAEDSAATEPAPADEPPKPISAPEPPAAEDAFKLEHEIVPSPKPPEPILEPEPIHEPEAKHEPETATAPSFSRYAAPVRQAYESTVSSTVWRVGVLVLVAIALFVVLVLGVRALYRATSGGGCDSPAPETAQAADPAPAAEPAAHAKTAPAAPTVPRKEQNIPSLYLY